MVCGIARPSLHNTATAFILHDKYVLTSRPGTRPEHRKGGFVVTTAPHHSLWSSIKLNFPYFPHPNSIPYIHLSLLYVGAGDDSVCDNRVPAFRTSRPTADLSPSSKPKQRGQTAPVRYKSFYIAHHISPAPHPSTPACSDGMLVSSWYLRTKGDILYQPHLLNVKR